MKKNGFTLAEVLITLAIIGVVATLTLPALMTNTQEQQARTALKKGVNTLTEAASMNAAQFGFTFQALKDTRDVNDAEQFASMTSLFNNQLAIDQTKGDVGSNPGYYTGAAPAEYDNGQYTSGNYTVFLRDGSSIIYPPTWDTGTFDATQADGLPYGVPIIYDTNGNKGPNQLSTCKANAQVNEATDEQGGDCGVKANRHIYDMYGLRLRGSLIVPNGPMSRYMLDK